MNTKPSPPKFFERLFRWFCRPDIHRYVEGDLIELYEIRRRNLGPRIARIRYAIDVLLLFRPGIVRTIKKNQTLNHYDMFSNYFKISLRNIVKYKAFSFINIFGLALAMSVCMLVIVMLADQLRYDQFHANKDRIYRILSYDERATSPFPLASTLKADYPVVEDACQLTPAPGGDAIYNNRLADMRGYFADQSFLNIFSFELAYGNPKTALTEARSIVISKEMVKLLFKDEDPLGKTIAFSDRKLSFPQEFDGIASPAVDWGNFTVTGVIDETKYRSHLRFDMLISSSTMPLLYAEKKLDDNSNNWEWYYRTYTFALLKEGKHRNDLQAALNDVVARKYKDLKSEQVKNFKLGAQPLGDIQLGLNGNDTNTRLPAMGYYILGGLAIVIMLSACLNYTNLSIARALTRAKEIGVRKVTGANRKSIVMQFLSESVLTSLFAMFMGYILLILIRRSFTNLWINQYLNFELPDSATIYIAFFLFAILIGIIAGIYPAFRLSAYQPVKALKALASAYSGKLRMYKVLSVIQFIVSLFFITTSILIFNQFRHYMGFDYGFRSRNVINLELQGNDHKKLANEMRSVAGVLEVSASDLVPATGTNNGNDFRRSGSGDDQFRFLSVLHVDANYVPNLDLKIVAGRNLSVHDEAGRFVVVNESAVKELGFGHPSEIIGQTIESKWGNESLEVVGVVQNFRYKLLLNQDQIGGLLLRNQPDQFRYLNIRIAAGNRSATMGHIEERWRKIDPLHHIQYKFFDDELASTHQAIVDVVTILGFIAFLSVVIACLGLLGMATYTAERRRKEVGIRKILGAADLGLAIMLSKDFMKMLALSIFIGAPLSYFINNMWLINLPNRVGFGAGTVAIAVSILFILGMITVGSQSLRASNTNPVDSIKAE